jgi:L-threonylcarbamoyladenylate synthase
MPKHPVAQALITAAKCPLAAPSANRFGRISPTTAQAVIDELGDRIRFILDGGTCEIGLESTIVGFDPDHGIEVLRPGGTSVESLEHALGTPLIRKTRSSSEVRPEIRSPGMLESHYAPKKQLILLPKKVSELNQNDVQTLMDSQHVSPQSSVGLILMSGHPVESATHFNQLSGHPVHCRTLSLSGDLKEAAHSLFGEMRYLDASDAELIFAEPCNSQLGIGYAISDRLKRASARRT